MDAEHISESEAAARIRPQLEGFSRVAAETCAMIEKWGTYSGERNLAVLLRALEPQLPRVYLAALDLPGTEEVSDRETEGWHALDPVLDALRDQPFWGDLGPSLHSAVERAWQRFTPDFEDAADLGGHLKVIGASFDETSRVYLWLKAGLALLDEGSPTGTIRALWTWRSEFDQWMGQSLLKLLWAVYQVRRGLLPFPPSHNRVGSPGQRYVRLVDLARADDPDTTGSLPSASAVAARLRPQLEAFSRVATEACAAIEEWWAFAEERDLGALLTALEPQLPRLYLGILNLPGLEPDDLEDDRWHALDPLLKAVYDQLFDSDLECRLSIAADRAWERFTPDFVAANPLSQHLVVITHEMFGFYSWLKEGLALFDEGSAAGTIRAHWRWRSDFDEWEGESVVKLLWAVHEVRRDLLPFPHSYIAE